MAKREGSEKGRGAKHSWILKASKAKMDWPCYKILDRRLAKKVFYGELQAGKLDGHSYNCSQGHFP